MKDTFLVTGATGFVGSCIVRKLVESGENVFVLVRNKELNWRIKDISDKLHIVQADLLDSDLENKVSKISPTVVFHLASYGVLVQEANLDTMINTNFKGLVNLVTAVKNSPLRLFVNTGTSSEYGVYSHAIRETDLLRPVNDYGVTRAVGTLFCQKTAIQENMPIITLRLFSPFGYFDDQNRLIPSVILNSLRNDTINISSQKNVRDFIFIEDVVEAYMQVLKKNVKSGEIYNIGSGYQNSVENVVNQVIKYTGSKSRVLWGTVKSQERQIEPAIWQANIKKAKVDLDWNPKYTFSEGIKRTVDWFDKNRHFYDKN